MSFTIATGMAIMPSKRPSHSIELVLHMHSLALIKGATTISLAQ
jgi:hypothetical protein